MSAFYPVNCDKISHVATGLTWVTNTDIKNNVAYQRAFGKTIEMNTDIGVRIETGITISIGVVAKREQLISSTKQAVALAPAIRSAVRAESGGEVQVDALEDDADIISSFITKLSDGSFYACAFIDSRIIADRVIGAAKPNQSIDISNEETSTSNLNRNRAAQRIVEDIVDYISKPTDKFNVVLHYVGLTTDDRTAIKMAFNGSPYVSESEQVKVVREDSFDETLDDVLSQLSENELQYIRSVAKYVGKTADSDKIKYGLAALIVLGFCYWAFFMPSGSSSKKSSYKEYAPVESMQPTQTLLPVAQPKQKLSASYLEQMRLEEINWITEHIRKSGYRAFDALQNNVGGLNMEVNGYALNLVVFEDKFLPETASLDSILHIQYVRDSKQVITDFTKVFPTANAKLDGSSAIVEQPMRKSSREKPFIYSENYKIDVNELIASLQKLRDKGVVTNWSLIKGEAPKRPRKYTKEEEAFLSSIQKGSEERWVVPLSTYKLEMEFKNVTTLSELEKLFQSIITATISVFSYDATNQNATIEVTIYEL